MSGPSAALVADALAGVATRLPPSLAEPLAELCARATDPPTVAIAGRVSAGKSTLVNALVGRRVAPTDAGECTQVVAHFRFGRSERVHVHINSGAVIDLPFDDQGRIPERLGVPVGEVSHLEVHLANQRLRRLELIDTPGVSAGSSGSSRTEAYLGFDVASRAAVGRADAVVYLLTHTGRTDEAADLAAFGSAAGNRSDAAIGVLGKADLVAGGRPDAVVELAAKLRSNLADDVAAVVPVWTLVAETISCGRLREPDAATVAAVAALDDVDRALLLADAGLFAEHAVEVDHHARRRLLDLLGHAGAVRAVELAAENVRGAVQLTDALDRLSGRSQLDTAIDDLAGRADVLRAARMLNDAERLGFKDWSAGGPLRDGVEALRARPELHVLEESSVLAELDAYHGSLPGDMADEAKSVLTGAASSDTADLDAAIDRWREFEVLAGDPAVQRLSRVVLRTLSLRRQGTA